MHGEPEKTWGKGLQGAGEFIRVVNASKVYQTQDGGEIEAFTNFNLEIEEDEFLVLVGSKNTIPPQRNYKLTTH